MTWVAGAIVVAVLVIISLVLLEEDTRPGNEWWKGDRRQ